MHRDSEGGCFPSRRKHFLHCHLRSISLLFSAKGKQESSSQYNLFTTFFPTFPKIHTHATLNFFRLTSKMQHYLLFFGTVHNCRNVSGIIRANTLSGLQSESELEQHFFLMEDVRTVEHEAKIRQFS